MSDDRFKDPNTFKRPEKPSVIPTVNPKNLDAVKDLDIPWSESVSPIEYFRKAFATGTENHPRVQELRFFYQPSYDAAEAEAKGMQCPTV